MELSLSSLDITGYGNQPVPNTYISHPTPSQHLGIILPGYRYPADMPPLHYAGRVLLEQGADLLRVEYAYYRTNYMERPDNEQDRWIASDVLSACNAGLARHPYKKITLVGKSLGTIAMAHLLADRRFQQAACIWLTPLLSAEWLCSRIEELRPRSLFIIGTADRFYQPDILEHLTNATNGQALVLDGVDHSLEIQGKTLESLEVLGRITQAVREFVEQTA